MMLHPVDPQDIYQVAKKHLHKKIIQRIDPAELERIPEQSRRTELKQLVESMVEADTHPLNPLQRATLIEELLDEMLGFGPLEPILREPNVNDILVNGCNTMFIEQAGILKEIPNPFSSDSQLMEIIQRIISRVGRRVNESSPMVDARLPDGSRFNAIIPPLALDGPLVSIRRFGARPLRLEDLLNFKSLTGDMARFLEAAVQARLNIIVSGGTGSGKTTLLNTLSAYIPHRDRIVTIEDAAELQLQQRHVCRLESRPANIEGRGQVTIRELLRNALRMRPDRIVIGECRGAEALDMLQAMNTGHDGSLTTLHANSPRDSLSRLETMIMLAGLELPISAMRQQICSAVNLVVQIERLPGGARKITRITELTGMESEIITMQDLFIFKQLGVNAVGKAYGRFECTGILPHHLHKINEAGIHLPGEMFRQRIMLEIS
ncbi:MAG: CpaF family protein [Planctomycetia bacterium]|nr:CpaF family protein [Planctomycetia bacterium]